MSIAATKKHITLPEDTAIDAEVDLCLDKGALFLQARLNISVPGLERDVAQALIDVAENSCPYTKAIKGNVKVEINLL